LVRSAVNLPNLTKSSSPAPFLATIGAAIVVLAAKATRCAGLSAILDGSARPWLLAIVFFW
jgi:hypothetical protein